MNGLMGGYGFIYPGGAKLYNLTGEQLFTGWCKAVKKCGVATAVGWKEWLALDPNVQATWDGAAAALSKRITSLTTVEEFLTLFSGSLNPSWITIDVMTVAKELVDNWPGYFDFSDDSTCNAVGDVWLFKASKLTAKVTDVDGTKLKLRLDNGTETDWTEESEVAKSATKGV